MTWNVGWREEIFDDIENESWDLIVVGGGITGAGIFREAVNAGWKTLLVEANDFAFGTSSRSSKLIHGGIRYIRNGQFNVTYESVRERQWLLDEVPNLVTPLSFLLPVYAENERSQRGTRLQIMLYDLMAGRCDHRACTKKQLLRIFPLFRLEGLKRGYIYGDALMDDARVLLRLIGETVEMGGTALNYAKVEGLIKTAGGLVCGVRLREQVATASCEYEVKAKTVINATGPWSDDLRVQLGGRPLLRKLRGSHIILPRNKLPVGEYAVHLLHPANFRTMFALPWEGVIVVGTTDLDHPGDVEKRQSEPRASDGEIDYILEGVQFTFPEVGITRDDIIASFAGLRPVIDTGKARPSDESRAHVVLEENGMLTITGGKYTIFRKMAADVLNHARKYVNIGRKFPTKERFFSFLDMEIPGDSELPADMYLYMLGRYWDELPTLLATAKHGELDNIGDLPNLWAELRWAARCGGVIHLDDILLRRVRIGLTLPNGAKEYLGRIREIVQPELGWCDMRWKAEEQRYLDLWAECYSPHPAW